MGSRRRCDSLIYKGLTIVEWAEKTGLSRSCIYNRIYQLKWSFQLAVETPSKRGQKKPLPKEEVKVGNWDFGMSTPRLK